MPRSKIQVIPWTDAGVWVSYNPYDYDSRKEARKFIKECMLDPEWWDRRAEREGYHEQVYRIDLVVDGDVIQEWFPKFYKPSNPCILHPDRQSKGHLNVPCAPNGKVGICEECLGLKEDGDQTFMRTATETYLSKHPHRPVVFLRKN